MAKLNQIIAIVNGKKNQCAKSIGEVYKKVQKTDLFSGLYRVYKPDDEEGETMPSETKNIQCNVEDILNSASEAFTELFDSVATQEYANCSAGANIKVGETVVLANVPVTYLLFLEKQLTDINTLVNSLPVLDQGDNWEYDENSASYKNETSVTNRTKKTPKNHVLAEATKEHPAQVQVFNEDIKIGTWHTTKYSGAIPALDKKKMINKVKELQEAVKMAREEANMTDVTTQKVAKDILNFIFE